MSLTVFGGNCCWFDGMPCRGKLTPQSIQKNKATEILRMIDSSLNDLTLAFSGRGRRQGFNDKKLAARAPLQRIVRSLLVAQDYNSQQEFVETFFNSAR